RLRIGEGAGQQARGNGGKDEGAAHGKSPAEKCDASLKVSVRAMPDGACLIYGITAADSPDLLPDFGVPRRRPDPLSHKKGPLARAFSDGIQFVLTVMMMVVVPVVMAPVRTGSHRLEVETGDAGRDVQSGLALQADRLQRVGIGRTADQEIAAAADADRGVGADAAIAAGEFAAAEPVGRRIDGPGELGLVGDAEIEADAAHGGDIRLRPAAFAFEDALQAGDRA